MGLIHEWVSRPDLNWCPNCWFSAKIESKPTPIGTKYLCTNCGVSVHQYNDGNSIEELPRYYTDEEWNEYWEKNIKQS